MAFHPRISKAADSKITTTKGGGAMALKWIAGKGYDWRTETDAKVPF